MSCRMLYLCLTEETLYAALTNRSGHKKLCHLKLNTIRQVACCAVSGHRMLKRERVRATKEQREWGGLHGRKPHWGVCLGLRKLFYFQNLLNVIWTRESVLRNAQISAGSSGFASNSDTICIYRQRVSHCCY